MGLGSSIGGVVSGLINGSRGIPKPDLTALFKTIAESGDKQRDLINLLPEKLKPLWDQYVQSNQATGEGLASGTDTISDALMKQTEANYGPEATKAALDAVKGDIYSELPGQQNAIRQALAATGGFDRGSAGKQLASPVIQAAQKYASAAANITAEQLKAKQTATQDAINKVAAMSAESLQSIFGMNKDQALQILNGSRSDLKDQLTQLIQQNTTETNQKLGVQGAVANNDYNAKVADLARKNAMTNAWVNLGVDAAQSAASAAGGVPPGFMSALNAPGSTGFDPSSMSTNSAYDYDQVMRTA